MPLSVESSNVFVSLGCDLLFLVWRRSVGGKIMNIVYCEFCTELLESSYEHFKDFVRFFKEYMPRYGYKHLCTEDDDYKYYQTLNLPCIKRGFMGRHCNYGAPLKDVDV